MAHGAVKMPLTELIDSNLQPSVGTDAVNKVLHAIRNHLDMDVAFVAEFRTHDRIFRHVDARDRTPIVSGDAAPLEQGYCKRVVEGRLPELIPDTQQVPAAQALPDTQAIPIGAHLSVPIRLSDGRVFGTFCCFSFAPDPSLGERDLKVMHVFAALLADQIDRDLEQQRTLEQRKRIVTSALDAGQPSILYQAIYDLSTRRLAGLECLSRFRLEPQRPPDEWFAQAAGVGMVVDLELAAIRNALSALPSLPTDVYLALNCSPQTLLSGRLHELLLSAGLGRIVLEITEHDYIQDYPALLSSLAPLRAQGLRVAIDDAGAGYASLRHVLNIQPDLIKLDISLTRDIDSDPKRRALASALIAFARETQARIVAEGVETQAELRTLRQLGAGCAQGYFLARPMPFMEAISRPFPSA
ncbi:sensor domain-containing phosphodiesterase [Peristeroidobacter soli]|jgi:EAL domain-containing protein (putative c-di-GMP-specific phosphodiesterase class I)|uniref:sensor domain-containing phosphodiesterase n=1 Tax=Peristeroidobacter soli TaxID=2497877 RepID=UPI001C377442|nr:EAL domain-containing protein [Peristeroidobacter soli]